MVRIKSVCDGRAAGAFSSYAAADMSVFMLSAHDAVLRGGMDIHTGFFLRTRRFGDDRLEGLSVGY